MSNQSQFGHTLFLESFQAAHSAKQLTRLHFSKNAQERTPYDEAWLQHLIMAQPSLLPVRQIEPAFTNMVPVCVELPMLSGVLDNLFVTPRGDLALVECKLWRNPEARRQVVAQIIDYAKEMSTGPTTRCKRLSAVQDRSTPQTRGGRERSMKRLRQEERLTNSLFTMLSRKT